MKTLKTCGALLFAVLLCLFSALPAAAQEVPASFSVQILWDDGGNEQHRPAAVAGCLLRDGLKAEGSEFTLSEDSDNSGLNHPWSYTVSGMPVVGNNAEEFRTYAEEHYTPELSPVPGYEPSSITYDRVTYTFSLSLRYVGEPETPASDALTLTLKNARGEDRVFTAYAIFTGDVSYTPEGGGKLSNVQWGGGVRDGDALLAALKEEGLIPGDAESAADLAEALASLEDDAAELIRIAAVITDAHLGTPAGTSGTGIPEETEGLYAYPIENLAPGYYLVTEDGPEGTGFWSRSILCLTADAESPVKSDVVTAEKKVRENVKYTDDEGYGAGYNDIADACIGEPIEFELIASVIDPPAMAACSGNYAYVFHDVPGDGFTVDETSFEGYVYDSALQTVKETFSCAPVSAEEGFTVTATLYDKAAGTYLASDLAQGDRIVVRYKASLNASAVTGGRGNPNTLRLEYPRGNGTDFTPEDEVIVYTYAVSAWKADGKSVRDADRENNDSLIVPLPGAEFILARTEEDAVKYLRIDEETGALLWEEDEDGATILVSGTDGRFLISGLDDGVYSLIETKAPDGYNRASQPWELTIRAETVHSQNHIQDADDRLGTPGIREIAVRFGDADAVPVYDDDAYVLYSEGMVVNYSGAALPATGGIGTPFFLYSGEVMILAAGLLLVLLRKMRRYEE